MKQLILLMLLISCSHTPTGPDWVAGLRSGEERFKLVNGNRMLFRRIAGSSYESRDQACQMAIKRAEIDIRNAYPGTESYTLEVVYYDNTYKDCAVTLSVESNTAPVVSKPTQARSIALARESNAEKYAISGLTRDEFEQHTKESIYINIYSSHDECWKHFKASYSKHGNILVCWDTDQIVGYCTDGVCLSK